MLDPAARVHGFDLTPDTVAMTRGALLARASRWPDDDQRNENRLLRDPRTHEVLKARDGSPLPYDPATLDFGKLTGTSSQAHAHYALVDGPLSDDPEVLKKDPACFAVPPTAHAYGAEFAQLYTDLSLLAAESGLPSGPWLSACFAGAAFHHLEDAANQIHTVQVGIYDFFQAAYVQSKLRDLKTLGGLFGERKTLKQVGLRLISNHHLLSEDLFARHLAEAGNLDAPEQLAPERRADGQFALAIMKAMVTESSREAPQVYRLTWAFTVPALHDGVSGHEYDGARDEPDAWVQHTPAARKAMTAFYAVQARGARRAVTALRLWQREFEAAPRGGAVQRMLAMLLPYHAQAALRRASYVPVPEERPGIAWGYPAAAVLLLGAAAALIWSRLSKRS